MSEPVVGIIMGSQSDLKVMKEAAEFLEEMKMSGERLSTASFRKTNWICKKKAVKNKENNNV